MMEKLLFKEEQKFGSISLYIPMGLIYASTIGFFIYAGFMQFVYNKQWADKPMSDDGFIITMFGVLLVLIVTSYFLFGSRLKVQINNGKLLYSFPPFIRKMKEISKDQIKSYEIRKYKPIREYGGWGIKKGLKKYGDAYNVQGNIGLQLTLKNGKKVLFGTQRPEALKRAMIKLMT